MLDESSAVLDPIAAVAIENVADLTQLGVVDVTADHTIDTAATGFGGNGVGKGSDVLHRILDPPFEIGGQRPVWVAEPAARGVEIPVEPESGGVGAVAQQCQPAGVHDDGVEGVAMDHQQATTVRSDVDRVLHDRYAAELQLG